MPKYDSPPHTLGLTGTGEGNVEQKIQAMYNPFFTGRPRTPIPATEDKTNGMVDRQAVIRRIKNIDIQRQPSPRPASNKRRKSSSPSPPSSAQQDPSNVPVSINVSQDHNEAAGLQISRPRSALHRGDFREEQTPSWDHQGQIYRPSSPPRDWSTPLATSPVAPWHQHFPAAGFRRPADTIHVSPTRPRTVSQASLSGSFTYQPPTSPLVHQANAADILDHASMSSRRRPQSPEKCGRRHTYSPRLLHSSKSALDYPTSARFNASATMTPARRDSGIPYQAHQPWRSLSSFNSLPQTPYVGSRRPSISDASPLQHAPMVGSYEESILRGRMSTTPSKPLNFVAQIGVLGKGDCKPSLKCPPHVVIPFPAVFYSYSSGHSANPEPSPYVGMVDLENLSNMSSGNTRTPTSKLGHDQPERSKPYDMFDPDATDYGVRRHRERKIRKQAVSPKSQPSGCYRIPQQGQLQIVIKNPNKTAVKLFLVPYDLSDMQPGQKTFIRQRSYSAGPIIDMPIELRKNLGTDRPEAAIGVTSDPKDRPVLRYLIHLHICCPSKGRFYLYQNIRVVFANRVPDGKEKLRSEIQMPEPRFSTYKPGRDTSITIPTTNTNSPRRRSEVYPTTSASHLSSTLDSHSSSTLSASVGSAPQVGPYDQQLYRQPDGPIYRFPALASIESRPASRNEIDTPLSPMTTEPAAQLSPPQAASMMLGTYLAEQPKMAFRTVDFSRENSAERGIGMKKSESLLSMRLKDLEMRGREREG